mgnify:FL=1
MGEPIVTREQELEAIRKFAVVVYPTNPSIDEYRKSGNTRNYRGRRYYLFNKYGITLEQYDKMCIEQDWRCAACKKSTPYRLVVDHDHTTGKVRALLCSGCNAAMASIDNPELLQQLLDYKKRFLPLEQNAI